MSNPLLVLDDSSVISLFNRDMGTNLGEFRKYIQLHFEKWGLTKAECEIGILILRGYSLREIAEQRGTSETTTRQQALSLYKKASLEGRHQLSAFFIEHLLSASGSETTPCDQNDSDSL